MFGYRSPLNLGFVGSQKSLMQGLTLWYGFHSGEAPQDLSTSGKNGIKVGTPTFGIGATFRPGMTGGAMDPTVNVGNYINTNTAVATFIPTTTDWTASIWTNQIGTPQTDPTPWGGSGLITDSGGYWGISRANFTSGGDTFYVFQGAVVKVKSTVVKTNYWCHLVFANRSGTAYCFVDGQLVTSGSCSGTMSGNVYVGRGYQNPSTGFVSDVRLWSRGLSDGEIIELYNSPFAPPTDDLSAMFIPAAAGGIFELAGYGDGPLIAKYIRPMAY